MFAEEDDDDDYVSESWLCTENEIKVHRLSDMIAQEKFKQERCLTRVRASKMLVDSLKLELQEVSIIP